MHLKMIVGALCGLQVTAANAQPTPRPAHDGKVVLFGNLHAHSKLSDDVNNAGNEMLPIRAFEYAQAHGLDFLAISDHHKAVDSNHRLWMTQAEYTSQLFDVATQYNQDHAGEFIAIPAIEWGNTSTGNHINVFGAPQLPPDTIHDADYDALYEWAKTHAPFVQFNHPNSWQGESNRNLQVGNFGQNLYGSETAFASAVDPIVDAISIICTVRGGHITGALRDSEAKTHREMQWENYYKQYLNMGFHIAPGGDQDTHGTNWGTVTAARAAVWADSASYQDLMTAFKANRAYATEDDELVVAYQVRHQSTKYWMGELVPLQTSEADIEIIVKVWQAAGSDSDPTDEGPYTINVVSDSDGIGGSEAAIFRTAENLPSGAEGIIPLRVVRGEYIYLHVLEQGGKDNPIGDGEDEHDNISGAETADGKRDDMNDQAWTAPIWFTTPAPSPVFVWSVNSIFYHDLDCWAAARIGAANRRTGPAPAGKEKHNCQQ
ncbi:MAG: hypothetical protein L0219_13030 [Phycisphaerales bacterium]|nr:hypothetical protein [Phycisphaerales bacterium]